MNALKKFLQMTGKTMPKLEEAASEPIHTLVNAHGSGKSVEKALGDLYTERALEKFGEAPRKTGFTGGGLLTRSGKDINLDKAGSHVAVAVEAVPEFMQKKYPVRYNELEEFMKRAGVIRYPKGRPNYGVEIHRTPTKAQFDFINDYVQGHPEYKALPVDIGRGKNVPDPGLIPIDDDFGENLRKFLRKAGL